MHYNILCLHGYGQNGSIMKDRMKRITREFPGITFDFVDSLFELKDPKIDSKLNFKQWYEVDTVLLETDPLKGLETELSEKAIEMTEQNLKQLDEVFSKKQYDGIIGFSQGSVVARWYISSRKLDLKFFISIGSFDANYKSYRVSNLKFPPKIDIYHVCGDGDAYVPPSYSAQVSVCTGGIIVKHSGKHVIPVTEVCQIIRTNYS